MYRLIKINYQNEHLKIAVPPSVVKISFGPSSILVTPKLIN